MEKFNHHMLTLARDSRALTQAELASRLGIMQGTLSKYETGLQEPPPEVMTDISTVLGYPQGFFYEVGRPYGLPPFHYRRRKKLPAKALARIVAEMNIRRLHLTKLLVSFDWKTNAFIPEIDPYEYQGRAKAALTTEDAARSLREMWMLPSGPIENMVQLIEDNGGIVVPCDFGSDLIDAISSADRGSSDPVFCQCECSE